MSSLLQFLSNTVRATSTSARAVMHYAMGWETPAPEPDNTERVSSAVQEVLDAPQGIPDSDILDQLHELPPEVQAEILHNLGHISPSNSLDASPNSSLGSLGYYSQSEAQGGRISPRTLAMIEQQAPAALREAPVIERPLTLGEFRALNFNGGTPRAEKGDQRLRLLSEFFGIHTLVPVRGDGNCFLNATIAGFLYHLGHHPEQLNAIFDRLLSYERSPHDYDPRFNKEEDFQLLTNSLAFSSPNFWQLSENQAFCFAFTRVLRYILSHHESDGELHQHSGEAIGMHAVHILNQVFNLNAKVAVLEAESYAGEYDPIQPTSFYRIQGRNRTFPGASLTINTLMRQPLDERRADFLILYKTGHYFCGLS